MYIRKDSTEKTICTTCSCLFASSQKTMASYDCPWCLGRPVPVNVFERWYNNGIWGIPEGMMKWEVADALILESAQEFQALRQLLQEQPTA